MVCWKTVSVSREGILNARKVKIGKHPATWFLRGAQQNTLKVQGHQIVCSLIKSRSPKVPKSLLRGEQESLLSLE